MFKNISSPLVVGCLRGIVVGILVGLATFGTLYGAGAGSHVVVSGVIGAIIPVWLGFLGWGQYDKARAAANDVHASDVKPPVTAQPAVAPVAPVVNPVASNPEIGGSTTPPASSGVSGASNPFPQHSLRTPDDVIRKQ